MNPTHDELEPRVPPETSPVKSGKRHLIVRAMLCLLIIGLGVYAKIQLTAMWEPPPLVDMPPAKVRVEVKVAEPEDCPVAITGYGEVHALDSLAVTPKVAGKIVYLHPDLEVGKIIPKGELLYRIDQRDYLAAQAQGRARIERLEVMVRASKGGTSWANRACLPP